MGESVDTDRAAAQPGQLGPESPLVVLERPLARPLSVGLALVLVATNAIGWLWFVQRQDDQLSSLQSEISMVQLTAPGAGTDPDVCWLLGASARAAGHTKALLAQVSTSGVVDDCADAVIRGANGYGR